MKAKLQRDWVTPNIGGGGSGVRLLPVQGGGVMLQGGGVMLHQSKVRQWRAWG